MSGNKKKGLIVMMLANSFPDLQPGDKGVAVAVLHIILHGANLNRKDREIKDLYDRAMVADLRYAQESMGVNEKNFGPLTKAAVRESTGIDLDCLPACLMTLEPPTDQAA